MEESGEVYEVGWVDRGTRDTIYRLTGGPYRIRLGVEYRVGAWPNVEEIEKGEREREKERKRRGNRIDCLRCGINPTLTRRRRM